MTDLKRNLISAIKASQDETLLQEIYEVFVAEAQDPIQFTEEQ